MALSIVITRFLAIMIPIAGMQAKRLSLGFVPIMVAGFLYGPFVGGIVGFGADVLGIMINAQGAVHLGFNLSSILTGVIPGLLTLALTRWKKEYVPSAKGIWISTILVTVIVHLVLNSIWLSDMFGTPFHVLLVSRSAFVIIEGILGGLLMVALVKILYRIDRSVGVG